MGGHPNQNLGSSGNGLGGGSRSRERIVKEKELRKQNSQI